MRWVSVWVSWVRDSLKWAQSIAKRRFTLLWPERLMPADVVWCQRLKWACFYLVMLMSDNSGDQVLGAITEAIETPWVKLHGFVCPELAEECEPCHLVCNR